MKVTINHDENKPDEIIIEPRDLWGLDGTLAQIIAPALKAYKKNAHGCFCVDIEDAPHLADTFTKGEFAPHPYSVEAFDYVMDEMIWAFEQIAGDDTPIRDHYDRIDNGTRLFGKYYRALWL